MKQAIILAGGKGTRLQDRLKGLPKPLVDICGIPLLERQIMLLKKFEFDQVLILVNHEANQIFEFCKSKNNWDLDIHFFDDDEPLGTAGATLKIMDHLSKEFLVIYGDTMLDVDLSAFYNFHLQDPQVAVTLFLHPNDHPHDSDLVEMDDQNRVVAFHSYPHESSKYLPNLVNAALYWIRKDALVSWKYDVKKLDFAKDLFPEMLKKKLKIRGYNSIEYIKDCGTSSRLDKVCSDFVSGKITRSSLSSPQSAIFLDRDGTINKEVGHLSEIDQFELLPHASQAIKLFNIYGFRTCIITNQPVIARGDCSLAQLKQIHDKMETLLGMEGAFIDRIYYCPHHPDSGFVGEVSSLKRKCLCRKPEIGMIENAVEELNIDKNSSWFVGDTTIDILTAKRAGLKSILVETGYAGFDQKAHISPNFVVSDLLSAAGFILNTYPKVFNRCINIARSIDKGSVIHIAGLSKSGKSTFANTLSQSLEKLKLRNHIISLDYLLDVSCYGKQDSMDYSLVEEIQTLYKSVINRPNIPIVLNLPINLASQKEYVNTPDPIIIYPEDIVIFDFNNALSLTQSKSKKYYNFYITCNEEERRKRVIDKYLYKKYSFDQAFDAYEISRIDKMNLVNEDAIIVDMDAYYTKDKLELINPYSHDN